MIPLQQVTFPVSGKNRAHSEPIAVFKNPEMFIMFLASREMESFKVFSTVKARRIKKKTDHRNLCQSHSQDYIKFYFQKKSMFTVVGLYILN